ncbi:MAG: iron ABC transporter permease [Ruminococcaceae bacterium]|nr:iron ABC transporter permease [Oscillospiraceae bacterium]
MQIDFKKKMLFVVLLCTAGAVLSLCLGAARLSLADLWQAVTEGTGSAAGRIFWYSRLPRTAACMLSGAGLAVSGAVIQRVLANKLASPGIIGVNAGAGMAVTVCCAVGAMTGWVIAGAAFAGALASTMLITLTAQKIGASRATVILGGVAVNSFFNAVSEGIITLVPEAGMMSSDFRIGGFSSVAYTRLIPAGILILLAMGVVMTLRNELDILELGEESAQGLGMNVKKSRTILLILAALMAGASVSFAGLLGFVGLVVPHASRRLAGNESRHLLPFCAVGGAAFVVICDLMARCIFAPYEIPTGILMALLGGPFFVFLLLKKRGGYEYD